MPAKTDWLKVTCGPAPPVNERMRIKLLWSEELRRRMGVDTDKHRAQIRMEDNLVYQPRK